jgi:hypothetical protein
MYDNATKDTWRGWAWNQIQSRVNPGSLVLCLCGDGGFDVSHANRRGFKVVGVDVQGTCVNKFREVGGIAVHDSFKNMVGALRPKGAVFDAMGGFTVNSFFDHATHLWVLDGFVWNGLRGRDREARFPDGLKRLPSYKDGRKSYVPLDRHRGKQVFMYMVWVTHAVGWCVKEFGDANLEHLNSKSVRQEIGFSFVASSEDLVEAVGWHMRPSYYSYKSKDSGKASLYFDSVALNGSGWIKSPEMVELNSKSRRKAAAAKALLTMQRQRN